MTNEEINRYLHTEIMGKCWGRWDGDKYGGAWYRPPCLDCGKTFGEHPDNPNYCSDESPRSLLNEVIDKIDNDESITDFLKPALGWATYLIRANAEQLAPACVKAHKAK